MIDVELVQRDLEDLLAKHLGEMTEHKHMHCPQCKRDLNQQGAWLDCRAHFVASIRDLASRVSEQQRALYAISDLADCAISSHRFHSWAGDIALAVLSGDEETAERLYKEASRTGGKY